MQIRIDNNGIVNGVILTADEHLSQLKQLPNNQIIELSVDAIPTKQNTYSVPVTYIADGQSHYYYDQVFENGKPLLDYDGRPVRQIRTKQVTQLVTLLTNMNLFTVNDVIQEKYKILAKQNYFQNIYAEQFYLNHMQGPYDSEVIETDQAQINTVVVVAQGDFKTIEISNDGGQTFESAANNMVVNFNTGGNGLLRVKFDVTPLEYGIMY